MRGKVAAYADWRATPEGVYPDFPDTDFAGARTICREAAGKGPGWLSTEQARAVLAAAGITLPPGGMARTADEAAALAAKVGFPVAVKLVSSTLTHKTDVGGVRLNIASENAARAAFEEIRGALAAAGQANAMDGVLVQPMIRGGVEVMVGVTQDPLFGPLIAFGLGGVLVEVLADVCFRIAPLTDRDAAEMLRAIRGWRLLQGFRGQPAADLDALQELLLRLARLVEEVPEIAEIDLNPVIALPSGCQVVDCRIQARLTP